MKMKTGIFFLCIWFTYPALSLPPEKVNQWLEDLDVYGSELSRRHIDLYHSIDRAAFQRELDSIKSKLPAFNEYQVIIELMRLNRKIGDGHTSIPLWDRDYHEYPFEVEVFDREILVTGASDIHREWLGSKLESINGIPSAKIIDRFARIVPFTENRYSERVRVGQYMLKAELLYGLGVTESIDSGVFEFKLDGKSEQVEVSPVTADTHRKTVTNKISYQNRKIFNREFELCETLWFASLHRGKTVYIYFQRYPSMADMDQFGERVLEYIDEHGTENIIVDFRENFGGNFFVGLKLAEYLVLADSIDWKSGVYVLIGNKTFSAAMSNSAQFSQILNARLVGQASGARPSGYQDMGQFHLPNSNLLVTYSKRRFRFRDTEMPALLPDVTVPLKLSDFVGGRDRTMEWVVADIEKTDNGNMPVHD